MVNPQIPIGREPRKKLNITDVRWGKKSPTPEEEGAAVREQIQGLDEEASSLRRKYLENRRQTAAILGLKSYADQLFKERPGSSPEKLQGNILEFNEVLAGNPALARKEPVHTYEREIKGKKYLIKIYSEEGNGRAFAELIES